MPPPESPRPGWRRPRVVAGDVLTRVAPDAFGRAHVLSAPPWPLPATTRERRRGHYRSPRPSVAGVPARLPRRPRQGERLSRISPSRRRSAGSPRFGPSDMIFVRLNRDRRGLRLSLPLICGEASAMVTPILGGHADRRSARISSRFGSGARPSGPGERGLRDRTAPTGSLQRLSGSTAGSGDSGASWDGPVLTPRLSSLWLRLFHRCTPGGARVDRRIADETVVSDDRAPRLRHPGRALRGARPALVNETGLARPLSDHSPPTCARAGSGSFAPVGWIRAAWCTARPFLPAIAGSAAAPRY